MMNKRMATEIALATAALEGIPDRKLANYREKFFEKIDIIDDTGQVLGTTYRGVAHRLGLRHRTAFVAVIDDRGRILVQTRGQDADGRPGRIDISVGGHLSAGERDPRACAIREALEELGLQLRDGDLSFVAEYNRDQPTALQKSWEWNRERRFLFVAQLDFNQAGILDERFRARTEPGAVSSVQWMELSQAIDMGNLGKAADGLLTNLPYVANWR